MYCPTCKQAFEYIYEPLHGVHIDYPCACGQLLQWDYPVTSPKPSAYIVGMPHPCTHPEQQKSEALFPLLAL